MKFLNLSSTLLIIILLSACHSTELTLRHSKVNKQLTSYDFDTQQTLAAKPSPSNTSNETPLLNNAEGANTAESSTSVAVEEKSIIQEEKSQFKPIPNKLRSNQTQKHAFHQKYEQAKLLANKNKQKVNGIFGGIGHAFGVVGLVFLLVGIILFLIGGIIIDSLGALFIGFGFLFLLIWLVLIILQVVFDVIL